MDDNEFALIKRQLRASTGIDLDAYKSPQVRRRLDGYLSRLHVTSWNEFSRQVAHDPEAVSRLRDFLAINVSSFFRDPQKWVDLRNVVLPALYRPGYPIEVWSAACSHGAEAYSLAILLQEDAMFRRYRILGTDIDRSILQQARAGGPYTQDEVRNVSPDLRAHYFSQQGNNFFVTPTLRSRVQFAEADLLDTTSRAVFDLIVCRNVLIYFTESAKRQILAGLANALKPGGILFIGATESIPHEQTLGLARAGLSFYRRLREE